MFPYAHLELSLRRADASHYAVEFRFSPPKARPYSQPALAELRHVQALNTVFRLPRHESRQRERDEVLLHPG